MCGCGLMINIGLRHPLFQLIPLFLPAHPYPFQHSLLTLYSLVNTISGTSVYWYCMTHFSSSNALLPIAVAIWTGNALSQPDHGPQTLLSLACGSEVIAAIRHQWW